VLYNGTTAVFEALESGVPAIYVSCGSALSQDPLFNLDCTVKRDCGELTNLEHVIAALTVLEPQQRAEGFRVARAYINDYFSEATPSALEQMLKDIQNV
jgi:UDP-N-acetylglucosamine:LPS N-acetylglucosamine transferase